MNVSNKVVRTIGNNFTEKEKSPPNDDSHWGKTHHTMLIPSTKQDSSWIFSGKFILIGLMRGVKSKPSERGPRWKKQKMKLQQNDLFLQSILLCEMANVYMLENEDSPVLLFMSTHKN